MPAFISLSPASVVIFYLLWAAWACTILILYWVATPFPLLSTQTWKSLMPPVWESSASTLVEHLSHLRSLALFWLIVVGLGRLLIRRVFRIHILNRAESFAFSFALGSAALSYLMLLLASLHLLNAIAVSSITFLILVCSILFNRDLLPRTLPSFRMKRPTGANPAVFFFLAAILLLYGFYALAPELFYDSLVYHLGLPQLYRLSGGMVPAPTLAYSGIPFFMEMLYTWALMIRDEILAKLIHWSTGVALASAFYGLCLRRKKSWLSLLVACVFLSTPMLGFNLTVSGVETVSALFAFLCIYALVLFIEKQSESLWILSALMAGFALSIKYTNWPLLVIVLLVLGLLRSQNKRTAMYGLIAAVCVSPWVLRNALFYGNPIYPYFQDWFQPQSLLAVDWKGLHQDAWGRQWSLLLAQPRELLEVFLHPWYLTFRGASEPDFIGPLFLIAIPVLFLRTTITQDRLWRYAFVGLWIFWWPLTGMPRFFLPGLCLFAIWTSLSFPIPSSRGLRILLGTGLILITLHNMAGFSLITRQKDTWDYLIYGESMSAYLRRPHRTYPTPYHASVEWINDNTRENARILVLGDARVAYLERPFLFASRWNADPFYQWLAQSQSAEQLKRTVDRENIRYILINFAEASRRPKPVQVSEHHLEILRSFFERYTEKRFEDRILTSGRWSEIYEIVPSSANPSGQTYSLVEYLRYVQRKKSP